MLLKNVFVAALLFFAGQVAGECRKEGSVEQNQILAKVDPPDGPSHPEKMSVVRLDLPSVTQPWLR